MHNNMPPIDTNNNTHHRQQPLTSRCPPPPDQKNCCQVCRKKKCPLLRCTRCQSVYYCSKSCQRIDWKKTHRQLCGRITTTAAAANVPLSPTKDDDDAAATHQAAQQAWNELSELLSEASLEHIQQDYHLASDKVKDLSKKQQQQQQQQPQNDQEEEAGGAESLPELFSQSPSSIVVKDKEDVGARSSTTTAVDQHYYSSPRRRRRQARAAEEGFIAPQKHKTEANMDNYPQQQHPQKDSSSPDTACRYPFWSSFFVEDMPQLGCYQIIIILLRRQETNTTRTLLLDPDGAAVTVQVVPSGTNKRRQQLLSISYNPPQQQQEGSPLLLSLPKEILADSIRVYSYPAQDEAAAIVSIRLAYKNHSDFSVFPSSEWEDMPNHLLSPSQANNLSCRHCAYRLLADEEETGTTTTTIIDRVVPLLPNGRWDDLQDYLICYPGEVDFDFSSAQQQSGQSGVLLENETMLVVHGNDLRPRGLCVLAIAGYGEEEEDIKYEDIDASKEPNGRLNKNLWDDTENPDATFRGSRPWRDVVGGATVTCGKCASILGYATLQEHEDNTIRLFKHQLIIASTGDETTERVQSIVRFVAHELVRYAETKAIFTFMVHTNRLDGNDSITKKHDGQNNNVLWLRLVSWDTIATRSSDLDPPSSDDDDDDDDSGVFHVHKGWQRIAKILFEETTDANDPNDGGSNNHVNPWLWSSGGDWCCPPNNKSSDSQNQNIDATTSQKVYSSSSYPTASSASKATPSFSSSYVRLCLPTMSEWKELRDELRNASQVYAREIVQATIQAKMGMDAAVSDRIGLAAVSLSWSS